MIHVWQARGLRKNPVVRSRAVRVGANDLSTVSNRGDRKAMIKLRASLWLVLLLVTPSFASAQEAPDAEETEEAIAEETDSLEAVRELEGEGDEIESPARLGSVAVTRTPSLACSFRWWRCVLLRGWSRSGWWRSMAPRSKLTCRSGRR